MASRISIARMLELDKLFKEKKWDIVTDKNSIESLFNRYCDRMKLLEDEEQELLIELSYNFEQIFLEDYLESFLMSFHLIDENILKTASKIIISPLIKPYIETLPAKGKKVKERIERPQMKSSEFLFYMLSTHDLRWIEYAPKFQFCGTISKVKREFIPDETIVLLVDDFIGSGDTAVKACIEFMDDINSIKRITSKDIYLVSIASMLEGKNYVSQQLGITTYSDIVRSKGISDRYEYRIAELKKQTMINMESKIYSPKKCPDDYSLGYKKSEALISFMNKTPNNTFPVFWYEDKVKIAPFPRYKNFQ